MGIRAPVTGEPLVDLLPGQPEVGQRVPVHRPPAACATERLPARGPGGAGGGRPVHRYALADFGLTGEQVDERFAGYRGADAHA